MKERLEVELCRARALLTGGTLTDKQYCEIYAVQQALSWAIEPESAQSPVDTVMDGKVQPPIREQESVTVDTQAN